MCDFADRSVIFRDNDCLKRDVGGGFCTSHGGGKRCKVTTCETKAAGKNRLCISHGYEFLV